MRDSQKFFVSGCAHIISILLNLINSLKVPQTHAKSFLVKSWSPRSAEAWANRGPPHHRFSGSEIFSLQGVGKYSAPLEIIVRSYKESIKPQKLNQSVPKLCFTYFFENLICCGIYACPSADSPQCGFLRNVSIPN